MFDDKDPTRDDFKVVRPDIRFSRKNSKQTLIIHTHQPSKLRDGEITRLDFGDTPNILRRAISSAVGGDLNLAPVPLNQIISGRTDAVKFKFAFPQTDDHACARFHFWISARKRDGTRTALKIDPQVGNDPPGSPSSCG